MYPVNAVLINLEGSLLSQVQRELAKASIEVEAEFPRPEIALDRLRQERKQPRLVIIRVSNVEELQALPLLRNTLVGWPILVLLESSDLLDWIGANRAGAWQVVPVPLQSGDLPAALDCLGLQFGQPSMDAQVIAFTGATGGCGNTVLAINAAYEVAAAYGLPTILAELALQVGMLPSYLDIDPQVTLPWLLQEIHRLDVYMLKNALIQVEENFHVLAGPQKVSPSIAVAPRELLQLIDLTRRLAKVVVLDVPCTYNDAQFEVLANADKVVLVGAQTVPSVRGLRMLRDLFSAEQVANKLHVILNRYQPNLPGFGLTDLQKLLAVPRLTTVTEDHAAVSTAVNHGQPLRLAAPRTAVLKDIAQLMTAILGEPTRTKSKTKESGMFSRLFQALRK